MTLSGLSVQPIKAAVLVLVAAALLMGQATFQNSAVYNVAGFAGADVGTQMSNCIAALPTFGGVCDARSTALTGAINSFTVSRSGFTLYLPCGFHNVNGSIIFQVVSGVVVKGCGAGQGSVGGTSLFWQGNATDPLLDLRAVRDSRFSDFTVSANSSHPLAEGIRLETWAGGVSTRRIFENINVIGNIANSLFKGMRWCTGGDCSQGTVIGNNDLDTLYNINVGNYTNCAYSIEGTQSKTHMFFNSQFAGQSYSMRGVCTTQGAGTGLAGNVTFLTNGTSGCTSGTYTVVGGTGTAATLNGTAGGGVITALTVATAGSYSVMPPVNPTLSGTGCSVAPTIAYSTNAATNAGSFRWYGGAGGSNQVADYDLGAVTDFLKIDGCNTESSRRLLQTGGASSAAWTIMITGCRWTSNAINPDGKAIIYQDRGPLTVMGLETESGGNTVPVVLSIESSGNPQVGNAFGNNIITASAAAGYTPFVCAATTISCWSSIGNTVTDNSNNRFQVPNTMQANPLLVSNLPACTAQRKGDTQFVTDQSTAVAYHGAVTGSGSTQQNVTCDGTNWYQN